ncbi:MAG: hypothetical protein ACJAT9_000495 [Polaribacter sp.]|jgi:hypothetical protein|tara:strand:- start:710 stop:952 length:243 start_codon:yes stop_codon:yes gene_type:complete
MKRLPQYDIGIIYHFRHKHAHPQLENYGSIIKQILLFLWCDTLNGIKKEALKPFLLVKAILKRMIKVLLEKGYKGTFGIF